MRLSDVVLAILLLSGLWGVGVLLKETLGDALRAWKHRKAEFSALPKTLTDFQALRDIAWRRAHEPLAMRNWE